MEWLSADPWPHCAAVQQRQALDGSQFLHLEAAEAVSAFWEDPAPPKKDFPRTLQGFEQLLSFVAERLTTNLPHLPSEADALAEGIEHLGFALSYSEEKGTGFFRVFQERQAMTLLVQQGLLARHTLRRVRAALFRAVAMILVNVKEESFPHLLHQLNQLVKGQPEIPDKSQDVLGQYIAALKRMALRLTPQNVDLFLDATAGPEVARLPLMEEAVRYVFHGYDMAETGSRVVCLCLLQAKNPRVHGAAVEVLRSTLLPKLAERLHCAWAQMATAMQKDKPSALQAALTMEQDALDFVIDLLSLAQPAVTQAVAELIVCGPLLSQLHVLAERHRYVNRPRSIWEILMIDVENNGPVPSPERIDALQAAEEERACAAEEDPPDQLAAVLAVRSLAKFLEKMQTERLSGILVPLIQLLLWPEVPAAIAESKELANDKTRAAVKALAELCTACGVEEAALATSEVSAQQRLSERQIWLRDCTGADLLGKETGINNPFRAAVQAMLHDQSMIGLETTEGSRQCCWANSSESLVPCSAVASWMLHACRAIHPMLLEDSGLLPKQVAAPMATKTGAVEKKSAKREGGPARPQKRSFWQSLRCF
ncbi:pncA [Symbiodinium sp. CCMP2456]|nr:pncA [Symbiodinium sp. CCMP2456]